MNIRHMTIEDVDGIKIDPAFKELMRSYVQTSPDTTRVGEIDGTPIFACGVHIFWPGVAEAWVQVFDESHAIGIVRTGQRIMNELVAQFNLHRLQATVRADDARTLRLDTFVGFVPEATIKEFYTDKTDAIILRYHNGT